MKMANSYIHSALFLSVCFVFPTILLSVSSSADSVENQLSKPVHLDLGRSTIQAIAAKISIQSGLVIEPADYLAAHQMTMRIDGVTARDALDAMAQIGGWKWRVESDKVVIEKPLPPKVRALKDVPKAMQQALTPDLRLFLGIGQGVVPTTLKERIRVAAGDGVTGVKYPTMQSRLNALSETLSRRLMTSALPNKTTLYEVASKKLSVDYTNLGDSQKDDVNAALLVYELTRCALVSPYRYALLLAALNPYELDPGSLAVRLNGNDLGFSIRSEFTIDGIPSSNEKGFGWKLQSTTKDVFANPSIQH